MPDVDGKKFDYTEEGMAAAKAAKERMKGKVPPLAGQAMPSKPPQPGKEEETEKVSPPKRGERNFPSDEFLKSSKTSREA